MREGLPPTSQKTLVIAILVFFTFVGIVAIVFVFVAARMTSGI